MNDIESTIRNLRQWGAEIDTTMERFLSDKVFYISCLYSFLADEEPMTLFKAIEANDYESAANIACALKGVTANMGLLPLYYDSCAIIDDLRSKSYDSLETHCTELINCYVSLSALISNQ